MLAVCHRLQHRDGRDRIAALANREKVWSVPQRVGDQLIVTDRALTLAVRFADLPRLHVRVPNHVEHIELGGVLDHHDPPLRRERIEHRPQQCGLARGRCADDHPPHLAAQCHCPEKITEHRREHCSPDQVLQADRAQHVTAQGERDVLRHVTAGGQAQPVTEPHHQQRVLRVELAFRAALRPGNEPEPLGQLRLDPPRRRPEQTNRTVGVIGEPQVPPRRHQLLNRGVGEDHIDRAQAGRRRHHRSPDAHLVGTVPQRRSGPGPLLGDLRQRGRQGLDRQSLLGGGAQTRQVGVGSPGRFVGERVQNLLGQ